LLFSGLLAEAWGAIGPVPGVMTGDVLGIGGPSLVLSADALRLGHYDRVVALLRFESRQLAMFAQEDLL